MLMTLLLILAGIACLAAIMVVALVLVMRRPSLVQRLMRYALFRRVFSRVAQAGMKAARSKAERESGGSLPATDLELVLAGQDGPEAQQAKQMLAQLNPRQRRELSRMTMGDDGLSGLMEVAAAGGDLTDNAAEMLGRSERRRAAALTNGSGSRARSAQQEKAIAKRRAKKKAARRK